MLLLKRRQWRIVMKSSVFRSVMSLALIVGGPVILGSSVVANPLLDPSFESPVIGPPTYTAAPLNFVYPDGTLGGWTFSPINNNTVSDNGAGIINATGTSNWWDWPPGSTSGSPPSGFDGNQFAFVQGNGSLSQTFVAPSSGPFVVTWLEGSRPDLTGLGCTWCTGDETYQVLINGASVGTFSTPSGQNFELETSLVFSVVMGQAYALKFQGLNTTGGAASFIDSVDVESTVTPIPAALPLFATGLGAIGLFGWRRRRKGIVAC
jgi:hypothetical protein